MRKELKPRMVGAIAAFLTAALGVCVLGWAQSADTPIVISDGSLTIESAVPWSQYTGTGDIKTHPHTMKSVTKVVVTMPGKNHPESFSGESCRIEIAYASDHIVINTGTDGKGLMMRPFSAFRPGDTPNRLVHRNASAKISHVTVTKGTNVVFNSDASGGTRITIDYQ
ncbi:MAG TPA: hypothetical protein VLY04_13415 [Bryobacteraceae bacterium]|nr:hypothetical protein [Bryobacteraceae bacterium]